jgi:phospho-N-acetylmuramoyl-pentapeptide-transferase
MERVLAAGLLAMLISIVAGPKFIEFLRRNEMGQHIREEGPESHQVKQGTPTMGGLLLVFSASPAAGSSSSWRRSPSGSLSRSRT